MTSFTAFATEDMHPPVNLSHIRHCDLLYKIRILNLLDLIITSCLLKICKTEVINRSPYPNPMSRKLSDSTLFSFKKSNQKQFITSP